MVPVLRGFDDLLINGKICEAVDRCSFDLDTNTFDLHLSVDQNLRELGIEGNRPDIFVVVTGVQLDVLSKLTFKLSNDYQFMNTGVIKGTAFSFDIAAFLGVEPCST
jgi:hypothetical protein